MRDVMAACSRPIFRVFAVLGILSLTAFLGVPAAHAAGTTREASRPQSVRLADGRLDMPAVLSGPVIDLDVHNEGSIAHELAVEQVEPGTTLQQAIDAIAAGDRNPSFFIDDPGSVYFLGAGEHVRYQRFLTPGTYIYTNTNADGTPQTSRIASKLVRVLAAGRRELPEAERTISLGDSAITLPKISAGTHRYAITNAGSGPHEIFVVGVKDPADLARSDEIGAWLQGGQIGPPPVPLHFPGSHQTIHPGVTVILTLTLHRATTYAFADFQTGAQVTATIAGSVRSKV